MPHARTAGPVRAVVVGAAVLACLLTLMLGALLNTSGPATPATTVSAGRAIAAADIRTGGDEGHDTPHWRHGTAKPVGLTPPNLTSSATPAGTGPDVPRPAAVLAIPAATAPPPARHLLCVQRT